MTGKHISHLHNFFKPSILNLSMESQSPKARYCDPKQCDFCQFEDSDYVCYFQKSLANPHQILVTHLGGKCIYNLFFDAKTPENDSKIAENLATKLVLDRLSDPPIDTR